MCQMRQTDDDLNDWLDSQQDSNVPSGSGLEALKPAAVSVKDPRLFFQFVGEDRQIRGSGTRNTYAWNVVRSRLPLL